MLNKKGKFIVIDGTDGSGKATQTELLVLRLKKAGLAVEVVDFPQYGQKSASLVEEYLNGKYGEAQEVGPYRASIFYAIDRYDASFKIKKWIADGKIVISNRYVTANMGHQGGKISNTKERQEFFSWLYKLEYDLFGIPKPDLNIILHVDAEIAQKLVDQKGSREYVDGVKRDIHEADLNHLRNAEKVYLEIACSFPNFTLIECVKNRQIMSREEINDLIWQEIVHLLSSQLIKVHHPYFHDDLSPQKNNWKLEIATALAGSRLGGKNLKLFVERLSPLAKLPTRAHEGDAGLDLYSTENYTLFPGDIAGIKTGIRMQIPLGFAGLVWDKSGLAMQGLHTIAGVIDSNYRGEIIVLVKNLSEDIFNIAAGQKIAQILIQKIETPEIIEGEIDDETERGGNGFGSSGMF